MLVLKKNTLFALFLFVQSLALAQIPNIGTNRELFVDDYLIEKLEGAELTLHEPIDQGEVIRFEKPWEGAFSAYFTVIKDGDTAHLWIATPWPKAPKNTRP